MPRKLKKPFIVPEITINRFSHEGRGVGKIDGKATFVFNALPGEVMSIEVTHNRSKFNEGEAREITKASPDRIMPRCQHFGLCGGCELQHLNPEKQIAHKQAVLIELLAQQGVNVKTILPALTSEIWGYRRKARLGVKYVHGKNKVLVGFRERRDSCIANLTECEVLHPSVGKKIQALSDFLYTLDGRSDIPQLEIAVDDTSTAIIVRHLQPLSSEDVTQWRRFSHENHFILFWQSGGPNTVRLDPESRTSPLLQYKLDDLDFAFLPQQFTQINSEINKKMVTQALSLLELNAQDSVLDLFCGIGNFSLPLAKQVKSVVGIEGDDTAVSMARYNALQNNLKNCDFISANLFEPLDTFDFPRQHFNKIVIDPPRTGALEIIPWLAKWQPTKLLYISCNPSTLARDAKELAAIGYTVTCAGVMDMFPHTKHVEAMALFECLPNGSKI